MIGCMTLARSGVLAALVAASACGDVKEEYREAGIPPPEVPGLVPRSSEIDHNREAKRLTVRFEVDPVAAASTYELLHALDSYLTIATSSLEREETAILNVEITTPQGPFLSFSAAKTDSVRDPWLLARIARERLLSDGRLEPRDIAAIVRRSHVELTDRTSREALGQALRAQVADSIITIVFEPPGPFSPATAKTYATAWKAANAIIDETVRYFPGIAEYRPRFPGLKGRVSTAAAAKSEFRLQNLLLKQGRLLGLLVRKDGRGESALDPASYNPGGLPISQAQIAVVRVMGQFQEPIAGTLFEEMPVGTGRLYVGGMEPDGTVTVLFEPWRGASYGPEVVSPGQEVRLGEEVVRNLGWYPRDQFRQEISGGPAKR